MIKPPYVLNRGFCILLLVAFLQACSSSLGTVQPPPVQNGETEVLPTNTPFQPVINTSTYMQEAGTLPSGTSETALPSLTNPSNIASPGSVAATQATVNITVIPPTQPPSNPTITPDVATLPPTVNPTAIPSTQPPSNPTITPDVLTSPEPPPADPTITPDIGTSSPPGDPRIAVSPFKGTIPTTYTFKIEKFQPGEQVTVQIRLKSTSEIVDSFVVFMDGNGSLLAKWTSQPSNPIADYDVKVIGANHGKYALGEFKII